MCQISNFVSFQFKNIVILIEKSLDKEFFEFLVDQTKSLGK